MNCATTGSSKYIPPIPSDPASIPMKRKTSREGIPRRLEVLLIMMLMKRSKAPISIICSEIIIITFIFFNLYNFLIITVHILLILWAHYVSRSRGLKNKLSYGVIKVNSGPGTTESGPPQYSYPTVSGEVHLD
jgi:hypothetical protein